MQSRFISLICGLFLITTLSSQNYVSWRGVNRSGIFEDSNLLKSWPDGGPKQLFHLQDIGRGYSLPIVSDNRFYIAGMRESDSTGVMQCYSLGGELIWKKEYGSEFKRSFPGARSTATLLDGYLYFLSGKGKVFKMDAKNGDILWSKNLSDDFEGSPAFFGYCETPLIVGDKVYFTPGGDKYSMVGLDINDGSLKWSAPGNGGRTAYCSANLIEHNGRKILVTMLQHHLIGVDFIKGDTLWSFYRKNDWTDNNNTPIYKNGMLYICTPYKSAGSTLLKISDDGSAISEVWLNKDLDVQTGLIVAHNGVLYGSSITKKQWVAVDWATGKTLFTTRDFKIGSIAMADGLLYLFSEDGEAAIANPTSDKLDIISRFPVFEGKQQFCSPTIAKGIVFYRFDKQLKAFSIKQ